MMEPLRRIRFQSVLEFLESLPADERIMVDVLRQVVQENLPAGCKEKLAYNVPFYYGKKRLLCIWPASVKGGGIRQGVLLGFWYGCRLKDEDNYLTHGTNKQVFYKIYKRVEQIDEEAIVKLIGEAVELDGITRV